MKTSKFVFKSPTEIDTFAYKIQKIALPMWILVFINPNLQLLKILKPVRLLFCHDSFFIHIYIYNSSIYLNCANYCTIFLVPPPNRILYQNGTIICSCFLKKKSKKRYNNSILIFKKNIKMVQKFEQHNGTKIKVTSNRIFRP